MRACVVLDVHSSREKGTQAVQNLVFLDPSSAREDQTTYRRIPHQPQIQSRLCEHHLPPTVEEKKGGVKGRRSSTVIAVFKCYENVRGLDVAMRHVRLVNFRNTARDFEQNFTQSISLGGKK